MQDAIQLLTDVWGSTSGHFRAFHDSIRDPKLARKVSGDFNLVCDELFALNQSGYGIYYVVNHGGHDDTSITAATAIMIDIDGQSGLPATWHCQPHIILRKGDTENYHVYWLLNETTNIEEWSRTCKRLIAFYNSDRTIHNPSRVMRLPDFMHLKNPDEPTTYQTLYRDGDTPRYNLDAVATGLPEVEYTAHNGPRGESLIESDDVFAVDKAVRFLTKTDPAIEGDGGDQRTFAVIARLKDFGLSRECALRLTLEHWNPRCEPPWEEEELSVKIENAYSYGASPQGSHAPLGQLAAAGLLSFETTVPAAPQAIPDAPVTAVQQPVTKQITGIDPYHISVGVGYEKNHSQNAARFIQEWYPGGTLRFFDDTWYYYDGLSWVETSEESMLRGLTMAMLNASPSSSDVSGSLKVLRGIVGRPGKLGTFGYRDVSSLMLVQNGILDVNTGQLEKHTLEYFTTNILPFEYDPNSACPTWEKFTSDIFSNDDECVSLLEEWMAYCMIRDYSFQKILMMIGASRGGKGTIGRVMKELIGRENFAGIGLEGLANDRVLEGVLNKTSLFIGDAMSISGPNRSKIVERLKSISGGDETSCARAYKTPFNGTIPGRLTVACNNILQFNDDSGALARRFLILPFNKSFEGVEDPTLEYRLLAELPGIANRCIKALQRLRNRGRFVEPMVARVERESITYRYSPIQAFIDDECVVSPEERVHNEELFARYRAWAMRASVKAIPYRPFIDAVRGSLRGRADKKLVRVNNVPAQGFAGLGLKASEVPTNAVPFPGSAQS